MLRVGLTGGIACGKSTVAALMRELGCRLMEADTIAHRLMQPGQPAYNEIVHEFGRQILHPDGPIDRGKLAALVFADEARLARLNQIVHPRVVVEQDAWLAEAERAEPRGVAVVEAPLLIESGYHTRLQRLVVTWCRPEQQMERLVARGLSREQAAQRIAAQMPLEEKRRLADDQIDCSGSLEATRHQVEQLVAKLRLMAAT
jgi:dephospho-CoA kinase